MVLPLCPILQAGWKTRQCTEMARKIVRLEESCDHSRLMPCYVDNEINSIGNKEKHIYGEGK